jgi:hypothetical protein
MTCEMVQEQLMKLLEEFDWKEHELKDTEDDTISNSWPDKSAQIGHIFFQDVFAGMTAPTAGSNRNLSQLYDAFEASKCDTKKGGLK